ncbi:DUF948 domain-containing protein [Chlorogloeopsis sp. ULAP02]|uniref:DUF948 domain-containing protein n=1 Tax=Chlorogloeopsis sp. ULAP02 TaxID=3107926 RepID=UPI003134B250
MSEPLFWLGLSILLVATSLTAVLVAAIPALQEVARAARSAEKFFDTLSRELPPTLDAIRMTSLEITDLTDDVSEGVKSASGVVKQVDQSFNSAKQQAQNLQVGTRSLFVGVKAALKTLTRPKSSKRSGDRLSVNQKGVLSSRSKKAIRQYKPYRNQDIYNDANSWDSNNTEDWQDEE